MAIIRGTDDDDTLTGTNAADEFYAARGNDTIKGHNGDDVVHAGAGDDLVLGSTGNDTLYGEPGDDLLKGQGGNDVLVGGSGNDRLNGGIGHDQLSGGDGDDILIAGSTTTHSASDAADSLDGGDGNDQIAFWSPVSDEASIAHGGSGNDSISGSGANIEMYGGDGNDFAYHFSSSGAGTAFVDGGAGDDYVGASGGSAQVFGGIGNDVLLVGTGATGDSLFDGGDGFDKIEQLRVPVDGTPQGSVIDLAPLFSGGDFVIGHVTIRGVEDLDDIRVGSSTDDHDDVVRLAGDTEDPAGNYFSLALLLGGGDDVAYGGAASEILFGDAGDDTLYGSGGNDKLEGYSGNDVLLGGNGSDAVFGGDGDDQITGGPGIDLLCGTTDLRYTSYPQPQSGHETFMFAEGDTGATEDTGDTILVFTSDDVISLKKIDADVSTADDDAFHFIGDAEFSGVAGELRTTAEFRSGSGDSGYLYVEHIFGDTDGDRVADLVINVITEHVYGQPNTVQLEDGNFIF